MFEQYKPPKKLLWHGREVDIGLSEEEFDLWMAQFLSQAGSDFDPEVFNKWWYSKVKMKALEKMVPEKIEIMKRRGSRFKKKKGIAPWHKRIEFGPSVSSFGGLHFGTEFGYHKELKKDPRGRKGGMAGSFVLMIDCGRNVVNSGNYRVFGETIPNWAWHDVTAAAYAVVEEAEKRKDTFTMVMGPRPWERAWDRFWYDNLQDKYDDEKLIYRWYFRDGTEAFRREFDPTKKLWNVQGINQRDYDTLLHNAWPHDVNAPSGWPRGGTQYSQEGMVSPPRFVTTRDYSAVRKFLLMMPNNNSGTALSFNQFFSYLTKYWSSFSKTGKGTVIFIGSIAYPGTVILAWKTFEYLSMFADIYLIDLFDGSYGGKQYWDREKGWEDYFFGEKSPKRIKLKREAQNKKNPKYPWRYKMGDFYETPTPLLVKGRRRVFNYIFVPDVSQLTEKILKELKK